MPFRVSGKNIDIGQALRTRVNARIAEVTAKYFDGGFSGHVTIGKEGFGFNASTGDYEDLIKAGVIDPAKVVRTAIQNASSVAGLMLTTETLIAEKPKKDEKAGGGHEGHGHDFE